METTNMKTTNMQSATTLREHEAVVEKQKEQSAAIWKEAEASRLGINILVLSLTLVSGGIAVPYAVNLGDLQFALVLSTSIFPIILVYVAPIKTIVYAGAVALILNLLMLVLGVLA